MFFFVPENSKTGIRYVFSGSFCLGGGVPVLGKVFITHSPPSPQVGWDHRRSGFSTFSICSGCPEAWCTDLGGMSGVKTGVKGWTWMWRGGRWPCIFLVWWQLKYFLECSRRKLGKMNPFWLIFFKWVGWNHQVVFFFFFFGAKNESCIPVDSDS